jgi:hypothetical protein
MDDKLTSLGADHVLASLRGGPPWDVQRVPPPITTAIEAQRQADEDDRRARIAKALPPGVASVVLGTVEQAPVVAYVASWHLTKVRGLVIRGGVGCGKSVAAGFAAALSIRGGYRSVSWMRPNQFVSAVLHDYDEKSPKLGSDLVIIDDVGRETKADFCEALCAFMDDKATRFVLTTNMQKEAFRAHYSDERLIDRLNHCAKAFTVKGDSKRMKGEF